MPAQHRHKYLRSCIVGVPADQPQITALRMLKRMLCVLVCSYARMPIQINPGGLQGS